MANNKNFVVIGLGNPGEKYENSRHNTGRIILGLYFKKISNQKEEWAYDKKINSLKTEVKIGKNKALFLLPETFMNKSGEAVKKIIISKQKAANLVVLHDDLDLPLGKFKISFNRGSAGHKGVESIIRAVKTEEFTRIRVGVSPVTPSGKIKKPDTKKLLDFIIAEFKKDELLKLKNVSKKIFQALDLLCEGKREKAMSEFN